MTSYFSAVFNNMQLTKNNNASWKTFFAGHGSSFLYLCFKLALNFAKPQVQIYLVCHFSESLSSTYSFWSRFISLFRCLLIISTLTHPLWDSFCISHSDRFCVLIRRKKICSYSMNLFFMVHRQGKLLRRGRLLSYTK